MGFHIQIGSIQSRAKGSDFSNAIRSYEKRLRGLVGITLINSEKEEAFFAEVAKQRPRLAPLLVLLDSRGKGFTSEEFASWLGRERDGGRQSMVFAIGPASGWSDAARAKADLLLSLGPMTLPHELARVVLVEQVYRAFTILTGHPYHTGH